MTDTPVVASSQLSASMNGLRPAGVPLSHAGGLPSRRIPIIEAAKRKPTDDPIALGQVQNLSPSLAAVLRPQAAYRWLLPYLASITPQYIESILRGALAGNHVQAWELFDLMIDSDPEIAACVGEYVDAVCSKKLIFEPYHEEDEEPTDSAVEKCKLVSSALRHMRPDARNDENDLRATLRDILFARFHGQSVLEIDWRDTYGDGELYVKDIGELGKVLCPRSTFWVHPVCYAWDLNGRLGLRTALESELKDLTNKAGQAKLGKVGSMVEPPAWNWITSQPRPSVLQEFPDNKFLIGVFKAKAGTALGASCLRPLAWWWVASNFCGDYLMKAAELFGIPFRKAKHGASVQEQTKAEIRQMLQACGSTGWILLPEDADLEFMEAGALGSQSPQAFLFNFADTQKRKVILHQTMSGGLHDSMGKGGGQAFGEVEKDTKSQCAQAGADYVGSVINLQFTPSILLLNYGEGGDLEAPVARLVDVQEGGLTDAQRDQVLAQIMDVPDNYLHRKYGIPKPQAGDKVAGVDVGVTGAQAQQQQEAQEAQRQASVQIAKHNAAAAQARAPQPGQGQEGQQQREEEEVETRRAIQAARTIPVSDHNDLTLAADALKETLEPLTDRLKAINEVTYSATRKKMLKKLLKDHPKIAAALVHDDSLAKAITPAVVGKFIAGLKRKP